MVVAFGPLPTFYWDIRMAYDFLGLVNEVNRRLNEVELTSANFATATGFYAHAKDAVNASIRYINQSEFEWPFNHSTNSVTLVAGTTRYAFPADAQSINFNTFRIQRNSSLGNDTVKLHVISYEEYLDKYVGQEYDSNTTGTGVPTMVFNTPELTFGLTPEPDEAYTLTYEYFTFPSDLDAYDDTPTIPVRFKHVIVDGAMHYAYLFRGNSQDAMLAKQKLDEGLKQMTTLLINRFSNVRSYMIPQNTGGGGRIGFARLPLGS